MVFFKFVRNKTGRKYFVMVKKKKPDETVVLITGASSGFGKATAELLADKGYRVYGTSRKPASENWPYTMLEMDVTKPLSIVPAISRIMEKEEGIDILINNAGFGVGGAVEETEWTLARKQFEVLLWGTLQVIRQVLPIMR
ncbi:MAG TPA: SDR family NAD(P)-dependent oxidoreductase, partial [Bacteroidetes bacterium]|nr:SDR family NAD(P)-dependent oxidoreductase [Bacteroidota bacterium]